VPQVLFSIPTKQIAPRLEALPAALGITRDEALLLVQDCPHFLLMKADTLAEGWQELRRAASKRPEWRQQIGNLVASSVQGYAAQLVVLPGLHAIGMLLLDYAPVVTSVLVGCMLVWWVFFLCWSHGYVVANLCHTFCDAPVLGAEVGSASVCVLTDWVAGRLAGYVCADALVRARR
jgi:hypothetical protein